MLVLITGAALILLALDSLLRHFYLSKEMRGALKEKNTVDA